MDCVINKAVFLRANGNMACWCTSGALHFLQRYDPGVDYGTDVYLGPVYNRLREQLAAGELPFPSVCARCEHVFHEEPFDPSWREDRAMACFHIEPSFACNLRCTGCNFGNRAELLEPTEAGHLHLAPEAVDRILGDLRRAGVRMNLMVAEGHGDPLCNRRVWELVEVAKSHYPETNMWLGTNAQHAYVPAQMNGTPLDEIRFAVDGAYPESYRRYRRGGDLQRSLDFMRSFRAANPRVRTVWKYIVFAHNDSMEELRTAQELARDMGIDALHFNLTTLGPVSHRVHRPEDVPVFVDEVEIRVTGSLLGMSVENLRCALQECEEHIAQGDWERARMRSESVYTQLQKRFFSGAVIHRGYVEVFEEFMDLARRHFGDTYDLTLLQKILHDNPVE